MTRRRLVALGMLSLVGWMLPPIRLAGAASQDDLELVAHMPQMAKREGPLLAFRDYIVDPDVEVERHIRLQVTQQKDLLARLKENIGFDKQVSLSVEAIEVRLMYVPQALHGPAAAYGRYCLNVTDFFFEISQMDNIYAAITSPQASHPPLAPSGICAFLVHRLAKEYRAVCRFTAESGRSVKYKATGAIFSNHLGAVDLEIEWLAPGQFGLARKPYTIWQNNGDAFYTLMALPVEETLHYFLGTATDRQIAEALRTDPPMTLAAARNVADEWMAVEESVVGGLVNRVLARYCAQHNMSLPASTVPSLHQYRYRDQGIRVVQNLGFHETVAMYMDNPSNFRERLFGQQEA